MEAVVSEEPQGESFASLTPACLPPLKQLHQGLPQSPRCCTELLCPFDAGTA